MKTILTVFFAALFILAISAYICIGEEASDDYVYALKIDGGNLYRVAHLKKREKGETTKEKVRRMELITPGTALELEKGTSVALTCAECNTVHLTYKDSPYTVRMEDFKKDRSVMGELRKYFLNALQNFIYPDSSPGQKVFLRTRGIRDELWPPNREYIIPLADHVNFKWELEGERFYLEIKEFGSNDTIYSKKTISNMVKVPAKIFKHGKRYEWFLEEEDTGERYSATFSLLSKDEAAATMNVFNDLPSLLPPDADEETKYRLQASFLRSEGLIYDAWQWLEIKEVSQQTKKEQ